MNKKTCALIFAALVIINAFPQTVYANDTVIKPRRGVHTAYISGYPDGSVHPESYVTREEAASIFYRLEENDSKKYYMPFNDY